jgi:hypothetical protein
MENAYILSLDLSTTNIGFCLWSDTGNLIEMKHLELKTPKDISVNNRDIYKAQIFLNYVNDYKKYVSDLLNGKIIHIVIEEPLFGSNNSLTVSTLMSFNGICRFILYQVFNIYSQKISIYEIRKLMCPEFVNLTKVKGVIKETLSFPKGWKSEEKKKYIWEKVARMLPDAKWFYKKNGKDLSNLNYDLSDSYACGYAYFKKINK